MATATLIITLFLLFTLMSGTTTSCKNCPVLCKQTVTRGLVADLRRHSLKTVPDRERPSTNIDQGRCPVRSCKSQHRHEAAIVRWITIRNQHGYRPSGWKVADALWTSMGAANVGLRIAENDGRPWTFYVSPSGKRAARQRPPLEYPSGRTYRRHRGPQRPFDL
jgi:hypothetical protein